MKFEKVSSKVYSSFLVKHGDKLESAQQRNDKLTYFEDELPLPVRGTSKAAGYDFTCPVDVYIAPGQKVLIPTGIKVELDDNKVLDLYTRSSLGTKFDCVLANTVGIIDADYYNNEDNEGHILAMIKNTGTTPVQIKQGDRFVQGVITQFFVVEGDTIGEGKTRAGGLGSTGK